MMNFSTLTSIMGTATLSFLLGLLVHRAFVSMNQKQNEQHDSAGPQVNQGALIIAPHPTINAPLAIADGRAPRLIQDANTPAGNGQLVAIGNPPNNRSFPRQLVSQLATFLSIIWAYLCPLFNRANLVIAEILDQFANIDKRAALRRLVIWAELAISDLYVIMDWIFFRHSAGNFLFATFYFVRAFLVAFLVALYASFLVPVPSWYACEPVTYVLVFFVVSVVLVLVPCLDYMGRHFPWHQFNMPRGDVGGIISLAFLLYFYTSVFVCLVPLIDAFMPGPLRETAHPIAFWLRQHGVFSLLASLLFELSEFMSFCSVLLVQLFREFIFFVGAVLAHLCGSYGEIFREFITCILLAIAELIQIIREFISFVSAVLTHLCG